MKTRRETFEKSERLCSTKIISGLFENGIIFHNRLFKVVWSISPVQIPYPAQIAFSVSKRGFRLAVTRNLIKRRIREAYRKNKYLLYEFLTSENKQVVLIVIMKGTAVPDYPAIEKSITDILNRLIIQIKGNVETTGGL
jgi:ribonuclease P protein component